MNKDQIKQRKEELEKTHGSIMVIQVEDAVAFFRKPKRAEVSYAMTLLQVEPLNAYASILESCYVDGDRRILDDDEYFIPASPLANELISNKKAEVLKF